MLLPNTIRHVVIDTHRTAGQPLPQRFSFLFLNSLKRLLKLSQTFSTRSVRAPPNASWRTMTRLTLGYTDGTRWRSLASEEN